MDITIALQAIINTLGEISIDGVDNWRKMLNCVDSLENIIKAINDAREAQNGESDGKDNF